MENSEKLLQKAIELQQTNKPAAADEIYTRLLARDPGNPNVLGLRGMLALAKGQRPKAIKLLEKSLAQKAEPDILRRNLNNLAYALYKEDRIGDASRILAQPIPRWQAASGPDPQSLAVIVSLARFLAICKLRKEALEQIESIKQFIQDHSEALELHGTLYLTLGRPFRALRALNRAEQLGPPRSSLALALTAAAAAANDLDRAKLEALRFVNMAPTLLTPQRESQEALIGVTNWLQNSFRELTTPVDLHFGGNLLAQLQRRHGDKFRFLSVFVESETALRGLAEAPRPDVIYNSAANAEQLLKKAATERFTKIADIWGRPMINHPKNVAKVTRDASETLYAGLDSVIIPKIRRYRQTEPFPELASQIKRDFDLPVIVRGLVEQQGKNAFKADTEPELLAAIEEVRADPFFYVISFHENRDERGLYRKLRAAVVGDFIQIVRVDYDKDWNVHGRKTPERAAFYTDTPRLLADEKAICLDSDRYFGPQVMAALHAMRSRVPLEVFGIDFDVTPDNRIVFFEANASMNLLSSAHPGVHHPPEAEEAFLDAFRGFIRKLKGSEPRAALAR